jgi:hypothetical protein
MIISRVTSICVLLSIACLVNLAAADPVYLNDQNITVELGASMAPEPFANRTTAASLASVIDAPSAAAEEFHTQSTHIWVSGGTLELDFDFGIEYDLTTFHFWNYHSESHDVDNIDLTFYDAQNFLVGTLLNVSPILGNVSGSDGAPIIAEDYALDFPSRIRYVNAVLSGSNGQVDWNNMGFTGDPVVIDPNIITVRMQEPKSAEAGVFTNDTGVLQVRLLFNERIVFGNSDVDVVNENLGTVTATTSGSGTPILTIAFDPVLMHDRYTITVKDTVTGVIGGSPIDGDNDGQPGGDYLFQMEHRERFDSDADNDVDLVNFAHLAQRWLWSI